MPKNDQHQLLLDIIPEAEPWQLFVFYIWSNVLFDKYKMEGN